MAATIMDLLIPIRIILVMPMGLIAMIMVLGVMTIALAIIIVLESIQRLLMVTPTLLITLVMPMTLGVMTIALAMVAMIIVPMRIQHLRMVRYLVVTMVQ